MEQKDFEASSIVPSVTGRVNMGVDEDAVRIRITPASSSLAMEVNLIQRVVTGAIGSMHLQSEYDDHAVLQRSLRLEASADSRSVFLIDEDQRRSGIRREMRYEITPAELIAVIRARGTKLPSEQRIIGRHEIQSSSPL